MNPNLLTFTTEKYAKNVEYHPFHRLFNHPALISLLPLLKDKQVLDAGCGTGFFLEYFVNQGARVTGLDITPAMLERCKTRVPDATLVQADLGDTLPFNDQQFDLFFCSLALQYLEDWWGVFHECARVLKPGGYVLFSVHHPFEEFKLAGHNYFDVEKRVRAGSAGQQITYRRSISSITETLYQTGFLVERLLEPVPGTAYAEADPEGYKGLLKFPGLLVVKARKVL